MNYWHMQLHPNDANTFSISVVVDILKQKSVIGMGDWEAGKDQINKFFNEMKIGDIVAIKNGSSLIALVQVEGKPYEEKNPNKNFDWFEFRREISILDFYQKEYDFSLAGARKTLEICRDPKKSTTKTVVNWHRRVMMRKVMDNISTEDPRYEQIKNLWDIYISRVPEREIEEIRDEQKAVLEHWRKYKEKLEDDSFSLDDYTNRLSHRTELAGGYLCNFLERTTWSVFGSSKPGNADNFEVKLNDDETYLVKKKGKKSVNREVAEKFFEEKIKPLLKDIVNSESAIEVIHLVETADYSAKQILRKLAILLYPTEFIFIYSDKTIDKLYEELIDGDEDETTTLGKSYQLRQVLREVFQLDNTMEYNRKLSNFLWKYNSTKGVADEETPNVILYGPPGTGKTYTVTQNLDFLCKGDPNLYTMVQFHPSFTYEDFIEGIKPKGVSKDGNIRFELVDGVFKQFCKKAKKDPKNNYYFVVDEINRANLSAVFGETLLCIEKGYRHDGISRKNLIKTQYSPLIESMIADNPDEPKYKELAYHFENGEAYFGVPKNVFFIGMMNDVDKSIDAFDLALRRRFKWERMDCDYEVVKEFSRYRDKDEFKNIEQYEQCCRELNEYISGSKNNGLGLGKSYEFGHSFFLKISTIAKKRTITENNLKELFRLYLHPTLKEYLRSVFEEGELDGKLKEALDKFVEPLQKA